MNIRPAAVLPFESVVNDVSAGNKKVQKSDYLPAGLYPVVDQGQEFVGGFSNAADDLVDGEGPWIVFGDHTRVLKYVDFPFCMGADGVKVLKPRSDSKVDAKYLFHFLSANEVPSAGYSRHYKFLKRLDIPLPPLDQQRRIAAILDKADDLRRKRKRALELLDRLTQSIFLEMFGDLEGGSRLGSKKIGEVCDVGSGSTPRREEPANFGGSIRWVKTTEVKGEVISDTEEKVTELGAQSARLKLYPKGTVLVAMYGQGATRGKVGILDVEATTNQACAALVPGPTLHPVFLFHQLKGNYESLRSLGRGGNQPNLNGELVKKFEILVPPIEEQSRFVEAISETSAARDFMRSSLGTIEALFSSLQSRAFSGQL